MRFILAVLTVFSVTSHASLKLTAQLNGYDTFQHPRPMLGLGFYQPLMRDIALNTWAGVGDEPFDIKPDVVWMTAKAQVDFKWGSWTIAPGYAYKHAGEPYNYGRDYAYIKVDYQIF